jgi:hypothetical protein
MAWMLYLLPSGSRCSRSSSASSTRSTESEMVIAAISGSDLFGLIASVIVCGYLLYALLRGEKF